MANNQGWYIDHRNTVAKRWQRKRIENDLPMDYFCELARQTFKDCGWPDEDIEAMLKIIKKEK